MKPQQNLASSFSFFQSIDDPNFIQYYETYYLGFDKRENEIQQKSKNWALFMEDDMAQGSQNHFPQTFVRPSINYFDFKNCAASIENIPKECVFNQSNYAYCKGKVECKIEEEKHEKDSNRGLCSVNTQRQQIRKENAYFSEGINESRNKRLDEIMRGVGQIRDQIEKLMEEFTQ